MLEKDTAHLKTKNKNAGEDFLKSFIEITINKRLDLTLKLT
jgi:hypothetical protein